MKYSYFKNENGNYVIRHTDNVTKVETVIAFTDDAEKADFLCKAANAFKIEETTVKEAVEVLCDALAKDTRENVNSLYYTWQSNIAMAFFDEAKKANFEYDSLHELSNRAARSFLDLLIRDAKNDYPED